MPPGRGGPSVHTKAAEAGDPELDAEPEGVARKAASPEALRERQRRHRLREKVQPKEPASAFDDPWELGGKAVDLLHRIRKGLPGTSPVFGSIEECAELIRMLAYGPQPTSPHAEKPKISPGRIGMHDRWHVNEGKPCNCKLGPRTSP